MTASPSTPSAEHLILGAQANILRALHQLQAIDRQPHIESKSESLAQIARATYEFNRGAKVSARFSSDAVEARQHLSDAIENCEQFLKAKVATLLTIDPPGEMLDAASEISEAASAIVL